MQAAGPALCALLLACARGDSLTEQAILTDDQQEAVLAGEEAAAWTWASGLAVAVACCCWAALPALCCGGLLLTLQRTPLISRFSPLGNYRLPAQQADELRALQETGKDASAGGEFDMGESKTDIEQTGRQTEMEVETNMKYCKEVVRGELLLTTSLPFVFCLAWLGLALALRGEPPAWLQGALVVVVVLRACRVEERLLKTPVATLVWEDFAEHLWKPCPFVISKLEVADAVTDGLAIATVFVLERADQIFHARLEAAWGAGPVGRLFAPLVLRVGLSGLMLLIQVGGAVSQLAPGLSDEQVAVGAELAGLGAVARKLPEREDGAGMKGVVRGLLEGAGQLFFQSAAILAQGTGLLGEPALAASVALTSCTLLKQGVQLMVSDAPEAGRKVVADFFIFFVPGALMCCIVAGVALRLGMSETCGDSLLYDVGSRRCVPAPLPTGS